jgi:2-dehydropantoate 2-reductase
MTRINKPLRRIAVIGAGAIGSVFAAELAELGHDVVLCTRRPNVRQSVQVDHGDETRTQPLKVINEPDRTEAADWVLLATKAYDTAGAANWMRGLTGPGTKVAVLQNGIDHVERVRPLLVDTVPIVPAVLYIAAELLGTGHVLWTYGQDVAVPDTPVAVELAGLFTGSRLGVRPQPDFAVAAWRKILVNVATNPITTLTGRRMEVFGDPGIDTLARTLLNEAAATARSTGAELTDQDVEDARRIIAGPPPEAGTSMLYDRLAGRPTEHDLLLGAVVRTADAHGVPAPATRALLALMHALMEKAPSRAGSGTASCHGRP